MKSEKKKSRTFEKPDDDLVRKHATKTAGKRDRKISIYNPTDEDDEAYESFDDLLEFDPDDYDESDEDDF